MAASTNFEDSVACLSWGQDENPNVLLCSTWDGFVYLYHVRTQQQGEIEIVSNIEETYSKSMVIPCISLDWQHSAKKIIAGSIDGTIFSMDTNASEVQTIGKHDDAVKGVYYLEERNQVCSLSYDKTVKFWDMRSPEPVSSFNLGEKIVCCDFRFPLMAVGLSNQKLLFFNVNHDLPIICGALDSHYIDSPLGDNSSLSAISLSRGSMIGIASSDGRSNISSLARDAEDVFYLEDPRFTFKAHKTDPGQNGNTSDSTILYPIHAAGFHPTCPFSYTYFTAGGDGCVNIWNRREKKKLAFWTCENAPITAAKYSPNGKLLAYAYGYDYAKGIEGSKTIKPKLHIHSTQANEVSEF